VIETDRLRLRLWLRADRPAFETLVNTPLMMARLGGLRSPAGIDEMFEKRLNDQASHGCTYWATELRDTGELIGSCGIRIASNYGDDVPVAGMPEIGWRVADRHWGRGYAREAAQASIAWGWANLDAPAIGAWTTIANDRSWGLMERLGMARRPDLDFHLRGYPSDDPVGAMIVYLLERP
jgi:RimJ/RimL family protein N-acetyltransferase